MGVCVQFFVDVFPTAYAPRFSAGHLRITAETAYWNLGVGEGLRERAGTHA